MKNEACANNLIICKRKKKKDIGTILFIIGLLAYPILQWGVFWLYPNIKTFILPFMSWDSWDTMDYVFPHPDGLFTNFIQMVKSFFAPGANATHGLMWNAFFNTFHSLWINLIILPIATMIAFALSKHVPGEGIFRIIFFMPNIMSTVVMCLVFRFMFEGNETLFIGPVTKILRALGSDFNGWDLKNTTQIWTLIYIFCIWNGLSVNVVLLSSAFQRVPQEVVESARLDGITFFKEFALISVPLIMPTITTFLINSVIAVTGFFMQPYLLLGAYGDNGRFATIPWLIFNLTQNANEESYISVATIGLSFSIIIFPFIMLARYIGKKLTPDVEF